MVERGEFNVRKPSTDHWYDFSIGTSKCHLTADLLNREKKIRINMWIPDDKELYDTFIQNKDYIEQEIGLKLEWDRNDSKKASKAFTYLNKFSLSKQDDFIDISNKMIDLLVLFRKAFLRYI